MGTRSKQSWQMTELSSAVQRALISTRFHGDVSVKKQTLVDAERPEEQKWLGKFN
jgi:hypothetical protein